MGHEELGSLVFKGMAADTKHPGLIPFVFILPFAKKLHTGLVLKISTGEDRYLWHNGATGTIPNSS